MPYPSLIPSFAGPPPETGLTTHGVAMGLRPGYPALGATPRTAGDFINEIISKCGRVVHTSEQSGDTIAGPTDTRRFRYRPGPGKTGAIVRMLLQSATTKGAGSTDPRCYWTVGGSVQPTIRYNRRETSLDLDKLTEVTQVWTGLTPGTAYNCTLTETDRISVAGCTVWELPRKALDLAVDIGVRRSGFADMGPILDAGVDDFYEALEDVWKLGGTNWFSDTAVVGAGGFVGYQITSASFLNIWDGASTAWGATAPGAYCWPQYHGSAESSNIPVEIWANFKVTAGTGTVRLVDDVGTVVADLTTTSTSFAWVTATGSWNASASATKKIDVLAKCSGGGTIEIAGNGMMSYEA